MATTFTDALELLRWADRAEADHQAQQAGFGDEELMARAELTPVADAGMATHLGKRNGMAAWKASMGYDVPLGNDWPLLMLTPPTLLISASWQRLAPRVEHGQLHNRVWLGTTFTSRLEDEPNQPQGELIYPASSTTNRVHRVGVLADADDAPATREGTAALLVAIDACTQIADALDIAANQAPLSTARRYRAEATAYREHSDACSSALTGSLGWVRDFELNLTPIPPFAPITVPAQLRGYVTVSPF